jgi:hypothetical protein
MILYFGYVFKSKQQKYIYVLFLNSLYNYFKQVVINFERYLFWNLFVLKKTTKPLLLF